MAQGIVVDIQPKALRTTYTPLHSQFGITVVGGGSTSQFYYTNENQYIPNRILTPMKLTPLLYIVDPDGVLGNGDKSSKLTVWWYEGTVNNQIVSGADYTVNADGSLLVNKNVPVASPIQIICRAQFTDSRSGKAIIFEDSIALNSIVKSDERVTVSLDKDNVIHYNPIADSNLIKIKATVYLGGREAPEANCAYWWYKVINGVEKILGNDVLDIEYITGQGTSTLQLDAANVDTALYRCRAAYYTGAKPGAPTDSNISAETTLKWQLPAPLRGDIYSPMGQAIREGMTNMTFTARMFTNQAEITELGKHFFVKWFKKSTAAGSVAVEVGHGVSITLPVSELKTTGGIQMMVYPEISAHGNYEVLTDENGEALTDENGEVLIGF